MSSVLRAIEQDKWSVKSFFHSAGQKLVKKSKLLSIG